MSNTSKYVGPVAFVAGVHYPVDKDGQADLNWPLRWEQNGGYYRDALEGEQLHNDMYHENELDLEPGSED